MTKRSSTTQRNRNTTCRPSRRARVDAPGTRVASPYQKLLLQLQDLDEHELTTRVLLPLFTAIGYEKVEYSGGPGEKGKDIICWGRDSLGDIQLAVAQVKRYKPSAKASDVKSFSGIVNQLCQAAEKAIPSLDSTKSKSGDTVLVSWKTGIVSPD